MTADPAPLIRADTRTVILDTAIRLFAELGYSGVSTRMIARQVGIGSATLYHHFPDKDSLYVAAVQHAYAERAHEFADIQASAGPPLERLERMIRRFAEIAASDPYFVRLVKREQLEGDPNRMRMLVESTLGEQVSATLRLLEELRTPHQPHLLMMSILGMILHHYEAAAMSPLFGAFEQAHLDPNVVARHVFLLLTQGLQPASD